MNARPPSNVTNRQSITDVRVVVSFISQKRVKNYCVDASPPQAQCSEPKINPKSAQGGGKVL
jgi:hypothetical protein